MSITALFRIARKWNSLDVQQLTVLMEMWYVHTVEYYSADKKMEFSSK